MRHDQQRKREIPHISGQDCLDRVVEICKKLPRGQLLDIPCGPGALAVRLAESGFDVSCADIDRGLFQARELPFAFQDLNKALTYADRTFDVVVSVAGLQRIAHLGIAVKEFYRILKNEGILVVAIPNYSVLRKRISYLLTGSIDKNIDFPPFNQTTDLPEANFRMLVTIPRLLREARLAGFRIESLVGDRFPKSALWYFPVMVLIKAFCLMRPGNKDSFRYTSSLDALGCRFVILTCRKTDNV